MISSLTIVLTLKDRAEFTRRWMRYMNDQHCPYKILIADGGADEDIEAHLRDATHYPNLNYQYIRYPFDQNWDCYYKKQLDVCERVNTEYLLFADNDDFYLIDKIASLIEFLSMHSDYSGCRGTMTTFSLLDRQKEVINAATGESYRVTHQVSKSIENESPVERIECFLNEVFQYSHWYNWYCVFRSKKVTQCLRTLYRHHYPDVVLNEILLSLLLLRDGKIKVLDPLIYIRQLGSSQASASCHVDNNLLELFIINNVSHHFSDFIQKEGLVSDEESRVRVLKSLSNFIGIWCSDPYNQYHRESFIQKGKRILKKSKKIHQLACWLKLHLAYLLNRSHERNALSIPIIEKYVLSPK